MNKKLLAGLQIIMYAGMVTVNALANILPINGLNTGEVSALFDNRFVPAGFTFSMWGIIYLFLFAWVAASAIILWKGDEKEPLFEHVKRIAPLFLITCILNAVWIFLWHYLQIVFTLIVMLWLLRTLIAIYRKMQLHRNIITGVNLWTLYAPFVIYLAWICVATIANTSALLVHVQWNGFGMDAWIWSCIMIVIAFLLTAGFTYWRGELAFGLVTAWALYGIYKAQLGNSEMVGYTALGGSMLCLVFAVLGFLKWNRKTPLEGII
ncbi:MAG: hypothetical protein K2X48_07425 [Chitinophagaceae bacterium]|nr:hypothetical protein [Chitinophagaceae bacterium]